MPDKITTLKLVDNTDVFPNIKDENIPDTIMRIADLSKYLNQLKSINITGDVVSATSTSGIATFTTADISTLNVSGVSHFEGASTFGSDVEVHGKLTLNSPSDLQFKAGDTNLDEFNSFADDYYAHYALYRFSDVDFPYEMGFYDAIYHFLDATAINGMFWNMKVSGGKKNLTIPSFKKRVTSGWHAFAGLSGGSNVSGFTIGSNEFQNAGEIFEGSSSLENIKEAKGAVVRFIGEFAYSFASCTHLVEIGSFDLSEVTSLDGTFINCVALKHIHLKNFPVSFNISYSHLLEQSDLVEIISNLKTVSTPQTLTMGSDNLAKLTQDQILVATGKGWTLA